MGGPITTASGLVFIGASNDRRFRAFDAKTGDELWSYRLPANAHANPITYAGRDGRQFVVIAAGGGKLGTKSDDAYVAFALPER
jgi:quinoprotein glucose dehydrogenase